MQYNTYPNHFRALAKQIKEERAGLRCEACALPQHAVGYRDEDRRFHPASGTPELDAAGEGRAHPSGELLGFTAAWEVADRLNRRTTEMRKDARDGEGRHWFVLQLSVAHLDHDAENEGVSEDRLAAWCQMHHNRYDQRHRQRNAAATRAAKKAAGHVRATPPGPQAVKGVDRKGIPRGPVLSPEKFNPRS